jgi:alpha,alpha-trehalase
MVDMSRAIEELRRLQPQVVRSPSGFLAHPFVVPGGFYQELWDWDGFFISFHFAQNGKPEFLKHWALNFIDAADASGYVPGCVTPDGPEPGLRSFQMKPFLAQGVAHAARLSGEWAWVEERFDTIVQIVRRREQTHYDEELGLFFWDSAMPSGADNNPAIGNDPDLKGKVVSPDVNSFQTEEYLALSEICAHLGRTDDGIAYVRLAEGVVKAMNEHLWSEQDGIFWSLRRDTHEWVRRVSYSCFVPLWARHADLAKGRESVRRYLWNEEHMLSPCGLRSVSRQDPAYNNEKTILPHSNWQGPVWIIANWFYFQALLRYGFKKEASELVERLTRVCLSDIETCGSMHENYHAETGEPLEPCAEHSKDGREGGFVGWNLLLQDMIEIVEGKAPARV